MAVEIDKVEDIYELSPMQRGMLFHTLYAPHSGVYIEQTVYSLEGPLDTGVLREAWRRIIGRHPVLRSAFFWEELDEPMQVVYQAVQEPWEQRDWHELDIAAQHRQLDELLAADRQRGFDLAQPPLLRLVLLHNAEDRHFLILTYHHLLLDGWSLTIVAQEVFRVYAMLLAGQELQLKPRRPYRDYIAWLRNQNLTDAETFWRRYLQGFTTPTPLEGFRRDALDRVRSDEQTTHSGRDQARPYEILELQLDGSSDAQKREAPPAGEQASRNGPEEKSELQLRGGRPVELQGFTFSRETTAALYTFARSYQLTLNTLIQGAWALLLSRYSAGIDHAPRGVTDVVFGATVAGRPATLNGAEAMVGLFINTLPVRIAVAEQADLLSWLAQLQAQQAEAREYDFTPLVQVHGWSDIPREQTLFESLVVFENYHIESSPGGDEEESGSLSVHALQTLEQTNYPLVLIVGPGAELKVQLGYETARFSQGAMRRVLDFLRVLLESFMAHPHARLTDLSLLNDVERQQLLTRWNRPAPDTAYPQDTIVSQFFQKQALATPDAIALVSYEREDEWNALAAAQVTAEASWSARPSSVLTYAELDRRANQLAHYLRRAGVGPEVPVGLCMERSPDLLIGLLAILRAGGVFLPLDPGYPQERLAFLLADAQVPVLLTQWKLLPRLSPLYTRTVGTAGRIMCVDSERAVIEQEPVEAPLVHVQPGNAAYVIYTSGSTGIPKGVVVTHQALSNHCAALAQSYELQATDRVLQFSSISFDVMLEELFPSWLRGAAVVVWPESIAPAPAEFSRFVAAEQLTVLNIPSSYWHEWVSELARPRALRPTSIRLVVAGSEKVSAAHLADWHGIMGSRIAWRNAYGLTETTITSLIYDPESAGREGRPSAVPIGKPIHNTQVYILDTHYRPVPIGMPGELYISGAGLARGYLYRAELTAERFLPHPFSDMPGARLYRTGDLVRYLEDGNLEFLGRADAQVKLRGFRIELGEIEALLSQHASVSDAVVLAREDSPNDTRLVAYVVPARGTSEANRATISAREIAASSAALPVSSLSTLLRLYLQDQLPPYMIPAAFVLLDTFPRSPSGKVNHRALPAPERVQARADEAYVAPHTPLEEMLAIIWASVLRLERVSRVDHFFKLGGHSLQATQVVARLREVLRLELPVRAIYDAPTISALALTIEKVRQNASGRAISSLKRVDRTNRLPLSFAQQRLWFLDQLQPGSPAYTMPIAFSISGPLDVAALEQCFHDLVQRHEILRTTFMLVDEQPVQLIAPACHLPLPVIHITGAEINTGRVAEIMRLLQEATRLPFDLQRGPLVRATLLRLDAREHVLLLALHHIIADGWSADLFFQELNALYTARTTGQPATLPDLPVQYADYAVWQRQWLPARQPLPGAHQDAESDERQGQTALLETQLAYWRQQLHDAPVKLELPTDRPHPAIQTMRGAYRAFALPALLSQQLQALSREEGVTLFMLLLAAFKVLLSRYSNQTDIVVGTPIAGRVLRETENMLGLFLNTLALRTDLSGNISFRELLGRVREVSLGAYMHQDLPFERLIEELQPERNLSQSPLFQVFFLFQNTPSSRTSLSDLHLEPLDTSTGTAKFDLSLDLVETPQGLQGTLEYNTDVFEAPTVERMIGHYRTLLASVVADIDQPISTLPLLTPAENQQILREWNNTVAHYPEASTLHPLFEEQAERTPDRVAVVCEDAQLTYRELNSRANQLAHFLQHMGVGPDTRVGLCLPRSIELVVGLFGILKAGGAYIPLDPDYPVERLAFILQDAGTPVLLTQQSLAELLLSQGATVLCLDSAWPAIATESTGSPCTHLQSHNLAYVIYTSGSTGRPKGVAIEHRAVVNFLTSMRSQPGLSERDSLLALTSLSFDIAGLEIFLPLLNGARLEIATRAVTTDGRLLAQRLTTSGITIAQATPSTWRMLLEADWSDALQMKLLCGGEALPSPLASALLKRGTSLWNMYGPTESTIWSMVYHIEAVDGSIPIGRPIANTQIYILDACLNAVPTGIPGDLYIGGDGLSRGYLGRPDLTAEKFIPDPFSSMPGARLYQAGDLARYLPDGRIEFLGRADTQVKMRGFRIELGEIEAVLSQHPAVQTGAVLLREDRPGDQRLVAYVVGRAGQTLTAAQLHQHLLQHLPAYMLPSTFVWMDTLPLTPNGKVDRRALPAPDQAGDPLDETPAAPGAPLEEILAGIWTAVLGRERVGLHENFFDLGGHSLLATQAIARIRTTLHVDLPLHILFEMPTIAQLARQIDTARRAADEHEQVPLLHPVQRDSGRAAGTSLLLPLSFAQQRLWFLDQLTPGSTVYALPTARRLEGQLRVNTLAQSLNTVVKRHESLRTRFVVEDGQPMQAIAPASPIPLPLIDLTALPADEREEQARQLSHDLACLPFDLNQGPLLRVYLLRLAEHTHWLLVTFHHIITDGWSISIFFQELADAYKTALSNTKLSLPVLPLQYGDYALWQREWLQGHALEQQLTYWQKYLAGAPGLLNLPTDRPRPAIQTLQGATHPFVLSPELTQGLKELSRKENVTLFMTLITAFAILLSRYSEQDDLVVGSPIANRTHQETEQLIGFFVNTLPLRLNLAGAPEQSPAGGPTLHELLGRVREAALGAYAHQDLPFERLVDALQLERDLSYTPLFQVMFVLQNASGAPLELPELKVTPLEIENGTVGFDLTLFMEESEQGMVGNLEYNLDLFDPATIERMVGHLRILLEGMAADTNQQIADLALLSAQEQQQIVQDWNTTNRELTASLCLHTLFEQQVERTPEAIALAYEDQQLSYQELDARANQLAHRIQRLGVGPEGVVGLCLSRSLALVIGVLAVLKAGGAYVPLEPNYPAERLAFQLADAQVAVVLTDQDSLSRLPATTARVLEVERGWREVAQESCEPVSSGVQPENLAYIIYTSGSTGQPKGVGISHHAICNHMLWMNATYAFSAADRVLQKTSFSFDAAGWEFYAPLLSGARLVLASSDGHQDSGYLVEKTALEQISILQVVPTMLRLLLDEPAIETCQSLRHVFCGGEELSLDLQMHAWARLPAHTALSNLYGPTECTIDATVWNCERESQRQRVPIGRPITNTQIYILDQRLRPVPIGVPGELYIGGAGVARGYLRQPALTAERFVPHPFSQQTGERLYRTGDQARYLPDGTVEYLGRRDGQVKLRGYRIEPGEIEAVLLQHPDVQQGVVLLREDGPQFRQLVAYVVASSPELSADQLRSFLQEQLPSYMVPAWIVLLPALPLTPNGKLDRRALPAPHLSQARPEGSAEAPATATERTLAAIWQQVLGLTQVGRHDNFFALGGDSILSIQIVARATAAGLPLTPKQLFQAQTIAQLAALVEASVPLRQVEQGPVSGSVPLTAIQHWFFQQKVAEPQHWNQAILLQVMQPLEPGVLQQALHALLWQHDALRLRARSSPPGWHLEHAPVATPDEVPFCCIDLGALDPSAQSVALQEWTAALQASLDLEQGLLLRLALFPMGDAEPARLLLLIHHLVVDIVSWQILLDDLQLACQQGLRGQPVRLAAKTTSWKQWAEGIQTYAQSSEVRRHLDFWLSQPWDLVAPLPRDSQEEVASANLEGSAHTLEVALSQEETEALLTQVPQVYHTQMPEVLLSALLLACAPWTGRSGLLVDLEGHGRAEVFADVDVSRTVGWFTTLAPLVLSVPEAERDVGEVLKQVKEQVRRVPQRGLSFGLLRYLCQQPDVQQRLAGLPVPEVVFNYGGRATRVLTQEKEHLFAAAPEEAGEVRSQRGQRLYLLEINAGIARDRLYLEWTYSPGVHRTETIQQVAQAYLEALRALIAHCQSPQAGGYTPSDFPEAELDQDALDALVAELAETIEEG